MSFHTIKFSLVFESDNAKIFRIKCRTTCSPCKIHEDIIPFMNQLMSYKSIYPPVANEVVG